MKLSEREVCAHVGTVTVRQLRVWVRKGWVAPTASSAGPVFDETDVARIRLVAELRRDLGIGEEVLPVVLSLMDQVYGLRQELKSLAHALEREPAEVKRRVRETYRERSGR